MRRSCFLELVLLLAATVYLSNCTTLDFEHKGESEDDVYRLKIENTSDIEVEYSGGGDFYYFANKDTIIVPNDRISPGDPAVVVAESKKGVRGVTADIRIKPGTATLRLTLEKGSGTGANFEREEVLVTKNNDFIVFVRYGAYEIN